jgi:hypothetical protein
MASEVVNVEYFCNRIYTLFGLWLPDHRPNINNNWTECRDQALSVEWVVWAIAFLYPLVHPPKVGHTQKLATKINSNVSSNVVANKDFVDTLLNYLKVFHHECDVDCACPCTNNTNLTETCSTCDTCNINPITCSQCTMDTCLNCVTVTCTTCQICGQCSPCLPVYTPPPIYTPYTPIW